MFVGKAFDCSGVWVSSSGGFPRGSIQFRVDAGYETSAGRDRDEFGRSRSKMKGDVRFIMMKRRGHVLARERHACVGLQRMDSISMLAVVVATGTPA